MHCLTLFSSVLDVFLARVKERRQPCPHRVDDNSGGDGVSRGQLDTFSCEINSMPSFVQYTACTEIPVVYEDSDFVECPVFVMSGKPTEEILPHVT